MALTSTTTVAIFAKPPVPGQVKTRLIPALGADGAARLAAAMLRDTYRRCAAAAWAAPVVASTGPLGSELADLPWCDQGDGDLGARVERVLRWGCASGLGAIAVGADAPTLPASTLDAARAALQDGRAALAPSEDGGFVLIAVPACPAGLLAGLPWSSAETGARVLERLRETGFDIVLLPVGFDVDEPPDLARLRAALVVDPRGAPATWAVVTALGLGG